VLAGILFQLATMTAFTLLALDFIIRVIIKKPYHRRLAAAHPPSPSADQTVEGKRVHEGHAESLGETSGDASSSKRQLRKAQVLLAGVAVASAMIFVRGIYRSIELAQGWSGYLITHERECFILAYLAGLTCVQRSTRCWAARR
jgi:hypothetical protein